MLQTLLGSAAGFVFASVIHLCCRNRLSPILLCAVILAAVVTGSFSVLLVFYAADVPEFSYWMALLLGSFFAAPILKALPVQTNKSVTQKSRAFGLFILWISMGIAGFGATYVMATVTDEKGKKRTGIILSDSAHSAQVCAFDFSDWRSDGRRVVELGQGGMCAKRWTLGGGPSLNAALTAVLNGGDGAATEFA